MNRHLGQAVLIMGLSIALAVMAAPGAGATAYYLDDPFAENSHHWGMVMAHPSGSVSATACNNGDYSLASVKTFAPDNSLINTVQRNGQSDWRAVDCSAIGTATGADSTMYVYQSRTEFNTLIWRLAAYKQGSLTWAKQEPACRYGQDFFGSAQLVHPTPGPDNTLYYLGFARGGDCGNNPQNNRLYAVDATTGEQKPGFTPPLLNVQVASDAQLLQYPQIFPHADGVAVLYGDTMYFYDTNGSEQTSLTRSVVMAPGQAVARTVRGGDYTYLQMTSDSDPTPQPDQPGVFCTNSTEYLRLTMSDASLQRLANDDCQYRLNRLVATPDGGVAVLAGDSTYSAGGYQDVILKYDQAGTVDYVVPLGSFAAGSYSSAPFQGVPKADSDGNVYIATTAYENSGDYDLQVMVRRIDPTGGMTTLFTGDDNGTSGQDWFRLLSEDESLGISKGSVFLSFCRLASNSNCSVISDNRLVRITNGGVGHEWPLQHSFSESADNDQDGLTQAQEFVQGTSDFDWDEDGDGLTDYVESIYYEKRQKSFCHAVNTETCALPVPFKKDVFLEIDWMHAPLRESFEPSQTQVDLMEAVFQEQDINLHIDTGQYGGGSEVAYASSMLINADANNNTRININGYKRGGNLGGSQYETFDIVGRYGIWRYMILADSIENGSIYGIAHPGDDDALVAAGNLADDYSESYESQVSKTILHELGHNLCLANPNSQHPLGLSYSAQSENCISANIDSSQAYGNYLSIMNNTYRNEPTNSMVFSSGANGTGDFADWIGIRQGTDDFSPLIRPNLSDD